MASELRKVLFYACHKKFPTLLPFLNFAFELALLTAGVTGIVAILATKNPSLLDFEAPQHHIQGQHKPENREHQVP